MTPSVDVICADSRFLSLDLDKHFHLLATDAPYSPHVHSNATSAGTGGVGTRKRDFGFDPLDDLLRERIAIAAANVQRWSVLFTDKESSHLWRDAATGAGARYVRTVPWVRWSQPQKSGDRPTSGSEDVVTCHNAGAGRMHWNGPGSLVSFEEKSLRGAEKHPTEKPLDLMLSIVSWFSDPGEMVLDLTAGACTTGLAARLLGRGALCVELQECWAEAGALRVVASLSDRDRVRAQLWAERWVREASAATAKPPKKHERKTHARALRRLADALHVANQVGLAPLPLRRAEGWAA
jgi:site-specific DNA-methyltransferase (adenine-specific)